MRNLPVVSASLTLLLSSAVLAEDLGGGQAASHGRVPRLVLESWLPGSASAFQFQDLPAGSPGGLVLISGQRTNLPIPGLGTLIADAFAPGGFTVLALPRLPVAIPPALAGATLYIQGLCLDPGLPGLATLTDATRCDVFVPQTWGGNTRQTANSLSVIDLQSHTVVQTLTNSENGYITFSPDRTRAYVCEPGSQRNRVVVYDLTQSPITVMTTVSVPGGIRYGCAMPRDGRRCYVPIHTGIAVIDTDPQSPSYHTVLTSFPTPITGNSGSILTGPFDLAVTPDGSKLYIAYGETVTLPAPSTVGVVDLLNPNYPHTSIPVQTGGVLSLSQNTTGYATRNRIVINGDGTRVYTVESGANPARLGSFVAGFQNGGLLNVIDTRTDTEIAAIATDGYYQHDLAVDRNGRNVWIPQNGHTDIGELLRVDVDKHSAAVHQISQRIQLSPAPFNGSSAGPRGVDVTPDGALVVVSMVEDTAHPTPYVLFVDALSNTQLPPITPVGSLCVSISIQQW